MTRNPVTPEESGDQPRPVSGGAVDAVPAEEQDPARLAETRLAVTQRLARVGSWEWHVPSNRFWWSDELCRIFGLGPASAECGLDPFLAGVHPDDRARVRSLLEGALGGGPPFRCDHRIVRADGSTAWVHQEGVAEPGPGGSPLWFWGTVQDVTERVLLERRGHEAEQRKRETERLESLGVLAAGIAHDFNNILTVILGNAELLAMAAEPGSAWEDYCEAIRQNVRRAANLCAQMLAFAGKGAHAVRPLALNELLRQAAGVLQASGAKQGTFELDLDPALPLFRGDPNQVHQVAVSLVANAAEALGEAGGRIRVRTACVHLDGEQVGDLMHGEGLAPGRFVVLEVQDDGSGMDEATQGRIFEPFFTTRFTGRGLGLSAVLGIVRSHGGGLRVTSRPGAGTTVRVYFPAVSDFPPPARR